MTKEEKRAYFKTRYEARKEEQSIAYKSYYEEHKEEIKARQRKYYEENREEHICRTRSWRRRNPEKIIAYNANRNIQILKSTPLWLSPGMIEAIEYKYETAQRLTKSTGIPHEVDHIIPLQGKTVRGLHVPWNLRVVTREENRTKSNKLCQP